MNLKNIAITTGLLVASIAAPALAGSRVTNTYINGTETGYSRGSYSYRSNVNGVQINRSGSLKFETNFPNARGTINFNGRNLNGKIRVSTDGVDPFVAGVYSNQFERLNVSELSILRGVEGSRYNNTIYQHIIESDSF